mmetsp:Transcript_123186/g.217164  ORF Transcript_123186/g.217164 Transcript_123186/m.217164 type:complete len:374 (+) Transcript_123186:54-1175(+)
MRWLSAAVPRLAQVLALSSCWASALAERDGPHSSGAQEVRVNAAGKLGRDVRRWPPHPVEKEEYLARLKDKLHPTITLDPAPAPLEEELPTESRWPHPEAGKRYCNVDGKIQDKTSYVEAIRQLKDCMDDLKEYRDTTRLWGKRSSADNALYWDQYKNVVKLLNEVELAYPIEEAFDKDQRQVVAQLKDWLHDAADELSLVREAASAQDMAQKAMAGAEEGYADMWAAPAESQFEVRTADGSKKAPAGWWLAQNGEIMDTSVFNGSFANHGVGGEGVEGAGFSEYVEHHPEVSDKPTEDYRELPLPMPKWEKGRKSRWTHRVAHNQRVRPRMGPAPASEENARQKQEMEDSVERNQRELENTESALDAEERAP